MVGSIIDGDILYLEWIPTIKAADIKPVLARIRPPLVICINATVIAKVMFRRLGIELMQAHQILTFDHSCVIEGDRRNNVPFTTTHAAITPTRVIKPIRQAY